MAGQPAPTFTWRGEQVIRSRLLAYGTAATTPDANGRNYAYTPPAGKTAIVKHITISNPHTAARTVAVELGIPGGFVLGVLERYENLAASAVIPPTARYYVLDPANTLIVRTVGWAAGQNAAVFTIWGVLLDGVAS